MKFVKAALLFICIYSSGCALVVPVHEGRPSPTLGKGGVRPQIGGGSAPYIGLVTVNGASTIPGTSTAFPIGVYWASLDIGILENLDLEIAASLSLGTSTKLGAKYQIWGQNYFNVSEGSNHGSVALRYVSAKGIGDYSYSEQSASGTQTVYLNELKASGLEAVGSVSYYPKTWFTIYGGPKFQWLGAEGTIKRGTSFASGTTDRRSIFNYGGFAGLALVPHSNKVGFELIFEYNLMNVPATYVDDRTWYNGYVLSLAIPFTFNPSPSATTTPTTN